MTGKRFTFDEDVNDDRMYEMGVFSDNGELMETTDILNCLNNLHEENQYLISLKWNQDCINEISIGIQQRQLLEKENEELLQFKYKVYRAINERIDLLKSDYNKAVKAGMPSNSVYGEIELLEDLKKELGE